MIDALVMFDLPTGSFGPACPPRHGAATLVVRLNALARWVRVRGGAVVCVQHDGPPGDVHESGTDGWQVLPALDRHKSDEAISKTARDSFPGTRLEAVLRRANPRRVIMAGWATEFCVDTTVRSCTARGFETWEVADGHTTTDRAHL